MTDDKFGSLSAPYAGGRAKSNQMKTNFFKVREFLSVLLPMLSTNSFGRQTDRMEEIKQILDGLKWTAGSVVLGIFL
jgi:hypothetical protein